MRIALPALALALVDLLALAACARGPALPEGRVKGSPGAPVVVEVWSDFR